MEYIPGDNLLKMISNKSYTDVSERGIMEITVVLLKTVQFLHNNNIVHRDLKPENILFSINGDYQSLKLIDFGLSIGFREKDTYRVPLITWHLKCFMESSHGHLGSFYIS